MSDNSYTSDHTKFQELASHLKAVSEQIDRMDIAVFGMRSAFKRLNNFLERFKEAE